MQVFGLPGHVIRQGRAKSRVLDAKAPDIPVAARRDAVARWRGAMSQGLDASKAARAVGHSRASLSRWEARPASVSRRPHSLRSKTWSKNLVLAVERLREDLLMWGRAKIGPLVRKEGDAVSNATVGRILANLVARRP